MPNLNGESRAKIKSMVIDLLLLPSKGLSEASFSKQEEDLVNALNKLIIDPNWTDYLFYPSKNGLSDCMFESSTGVFEIDEKAIDNLIEKIESYQPIML